MVKYWHSHLNVPQKSIMKKLLLATAAFAVLASGAPTKAQAEIKLDLGGYFKGYAGFADQDTAGLNEFDIKRKSSIFFEGETTLNNGLTVGYHGDLFQENAAADNLESSFIYFSGPWGRMNFGREGGAANLLQVAAPAADSNLDGVDIDFSFFNAGASGYRQAYLAEGADEFADKITFITPILNGLQGAASFSPEYDQKTTADYENGMPANTTPGDLENLVEGALRYDGEFSGVGVSVGGGYLTASDEGVTSEDFTEWNAGLNLSFKGFSVGTAYINDETDGVSEIDTYVVGLGYETGAYNFGATYFNSQEDLSGDELDRYAVGAGYTFGPGFKFNGSVALYDSEGTVDNDATIVAVGTDIEF
jgi:outer membrane protein OmpU